MKMKIRSALPEDFEFVLKLTRYNMERIVTKEWNADWEKDVEPNFVNMWKSPGKRRLLRQIIVVSVIFGLNDILSPRRFLSTRYKEKL